MKPLNIITANVDFALKPGAVQDDLEHLITQGEIIVFQEAKYVDIDRLIKDPEWEVIQYNDSESEKGSGVAYKKTRIRHKRVNKRLGTSPRGRKILSRYIVWAQLFVKDSTGDERALVVASVHLPPQRYAALYPFYLASLAGFIRLRKSPVVIGGDWNRRVRHDKGLKKFADMFNGSFHGVGIDGFLIVPKGRRLKVSDVKELAKTHSDHHPVRMTLTYR